MVTAEGPSQSPLCRGMVWRSPSISNLLRRPSLWIAVALALVVGVVVVIRARGPAVHTTAAARRDLEQHIVASGRVRLPTRVQVSAQLAGLVVAAGAVEGQHVKVGDLLVQIDDSAERAVVAQAEAAVNQAKARVEQLRQVGAIVATEASGSRHEPRASADRARTHHEARREPGGGSGGAREREGWWTSLALRSDPDGGRSSAWVVGRAGPRDSPSPSLVTPITRS